MLRNRRPVAVATYEPGGGYGHPDHVRVHEVTARAITLAADAGWAPCAGCPYTVPAVLWAVRGEDSLRAAYRELAAAPPLRASDQRLRLPSAVGTVPSVAVPDGAVDLVVDVCPVLERVAAALRAHATQVKAVTIVSSASGGDTAAGGVLGSYALSNDVLVPLLAVGSRRVRAATASRGRPGCDG